MKSKTIKIIVISILFLIAFMELSVVNAKSLDYKMKYTIEDFCKSLERDSSIAYKYIDSSNTDLRDNIAKYKDSIKKIKFTAKDVEEKDGIITVIGNIDAKGENWNVEGFKVKFNLKNVEDNYVITDTDLFYTISPEHTAKFAGSIILLVFIILGVVFLIITTVIIVIVVIVVNKNKKK